MKFSQFKNKLNSTACILTNHQKKKIKGGNDNNISQPDESNGIGTVDTVDV